MGTNGGHTDREGKKCQTKLEHSNIKRLLRGGGVSKGGREAAGRKVEEKPEEFRQQKPNGERLLRCRDGSTVPRIGLSLSRGI